MVLGKGREENFVCAQILFVIFFLNYYQSTTKKQYGMVPVPLRCISSISWIIRNTRCHSVAGFRSLGGKNVKRYHLAAGFRSLGGKNVKRYHLAAGIRSLGGKNVKRYHLTAVLRSFGRKHGKRYNLTASVRSFDKKLHLRYLPDIFQHKNCNWSCSKCKFGVKYKYAMSSANMRAGTNFCVQKNLCL